MTMFFKHGQLRVTRVTVALEVDLPKFKDNKVGRSISQSLKIIK